MKDIKIFMKKKNTKGEKKHEKDITLFTEKEKEKMRQYYQERKQKKSQYRRNYYLTHKN